MQKVGEQGSEVARLLSQISMEYEAAQRGMGGLSSGMSKHEFITVRMERMGRLYNQLQTIAGDTAIALVADTLSKIG